MSVSAAKSRVMQARVQLDAGRIDDVEATLAAAERFLEAAEEGDKAPVAADIAALRALLAGTMRPEDQRALSAAQGKLRQARSEVETGNTFGLEATLHTAEEFLATITGPRNAEVTAVVDEIAAIRSRARGVPHTPANAAPAPQTLVLKAEPKREVSATTATALATISLSAAKPTAASAQAASDLDEERRSRVTAEEADRIESRVRGELAAAADHLEREPQVTADTLARVSAFLATDEARYALTTGALSTFKTNVESLQARLRRHVTSEALDHARRLLRTLEEVDDPFEGLDRDGATARRSELMAVRTEVTAALARVPEDDLDARSIASRLQAAGQSIDRAWATHSKLNQ